MSSTECLQSDTNHVVPDRGPPSRLSILLISTDQHWFSALGCYGGLRDGTPCRTPNVDRLAAGRVRFETAYPGPALNVYRRSRL